MPDKVLNVTAEYTGTEQVTVPDGGRFDTMDNILTVYDGQGEVIKRWRDWRSVGWVADGIVEK